MTILSLLGGLLASHLLPALKDFRRYDWLMQLIALVRFDNQPAWLPAAATLVVPVAIGALVTGLVGFLAGTPGLLLIGLLAVIYTLGPRHLDRDIDEARAAEDPADRQSALSHLNLEPDCGGNEAAAAALHAGLARWFGIIFWFAVLGVPGALLYRAARLAAHEPPHHQHDLGRRWTQRLLEVLNWPVLALMLLASALMTDFDRVMRLWMHRPEPLKLQAGLLDDLADELISADSELDDGLEDGRRLVWRILGLWLAVLSILLLAGLLS